MLKRNVIIWSKYRWNIEKWIVKKVNDFNSLNKKVELTSR